MDKAFLGWRVQNTSKEEADIDIFDVIGIPEEWGGTSAKAFVQEIRSLDVSQINLHINSPGGYVDDALAMYNAILQHPANVTAYIESIAASAASFVAMAADKVVIAKTAKMMIHPAHGLGIGNARDLRNLADLLDEETTNIASIYADKAGGEASTWADAMWANDGLGTTYRGEAAVEAGLADEVQAVSKRNLVPMRAAALAISNAGRTMSQGNLDKMHTAIEALETVHDAVCDMGADCPMDAEDTATQKSENKDEPEAKPAATKPAVIDYGEWFREAFAAAGG